MHKRRLLFVAGLPILSLLMGQSAFGQLSLAAWTAPSSGVAGVTNVNVTASLVPFPAASINPTDVTASFSLTCGGATVATAVGNSVKVVLGSTYRFNVNVPSTLTSTDYFVKLTDTTSGQSFTSTNCSEVQVTGSAPVLNACVAGSSMAVLLPAAGATGNVTAYVPKGCWSCGTTGVFTKNIEGALGTGTSIPTANIANSCSSNPATGQTVCTANNTDVYLITGTTLTNTLTSGSNAFTGFSGGECENCGVAVNASNNTAVINMGTSAGPGTSGSGIQILNLATNTFGTPFEMNQDVSENISVDPTRSLVLSADEAGFFPLLQIQTGGLTVKEFDSSFNSSFENDSSAEDCSTGLGLAPGEFTNSVELVNLNGTFTTSPYTFPNATFTLTTSAYSFAAGLSGSAVAQGSGHLAVVTGEFGGNVAAVLQLPSTLGSGATPSVLDYAIYAIPNSAACGAFSAGFDPHTVTAYTSPNDGNAYALFAGYSGGTPICLARVNMTTVINPTLTPRGGAGFAPNEIAPANLPASAVTFYTLP